MSNKKTVTARVNKQMADEIQDLDIPVSRVIEAGMNYFNKLDETQKKIFILENSPQIGQIIDETDGDIPEEILELSLEKIVSLINSSTSNFTSSLMLEMAKGDKKNKSIIAGAAALSSVVNVKSKLKEGIKSNRLKKLLEEAKKNNND